MKTIVISGKIGKDAETRTTQGGDTVTSFNVAVEHRQGNDKSTIWFSCSIWGKRGDALARYLTKGGKVSLKPLPIAVPDLGAAFKPALEVGPPDHLLHELLGILRPVCRKGRCHGIGFQHQPAPDVG